MNIDFKFDSFKFGVFHNPTLGIEIEITRVSYVKWS